MTPLKIFLNSCAETEKLANHHLPSFSLVDSFFESLDLKDQMIKIENINLNNYFINEIQKNKITLNSHSIEFVINELKLKLPDHDSVINLINDDTHVEVYNQHLHQIFRTLNYYKIVNFSVADLETNAFYKLFDHTPEILKLQMIAIEKMIEEKRPVFNPVPLHRVIEIKSGARTALDMESLCYAPLVNQEGHYAGAIHIFKAHNISNAGIHLV